MSTREDRQKELQNKNSLYEKMLFYGASKESFPDSYPPMIEIIKNDLVKQSYKENNSLQEFYTNYPSQRDLDSTILRMREDLLKEIKGYLASTNAKNKQPGSIFFRYPVEEHNKNEIISYLATIYFGIEDNNFVKETRSDIYDLDPRKPDYYAQSHEEDYMALLFLLSRKEFDLEYFKDYLFNRYRKANANTKLCFDRAVNAFYSNYRVNFLNNDLKVKVTKKTISLHMDVGLVTTRSTPHADAELATPFIVFNSLHSSKTNPGATYISRNTFYKRKSNYSPLYKSIRFFTSFPVAIPLKNCQFYYDDNNSTDINHVMRTLKYLDHYKIISANNTDNLTEEQLIDLLYQVVPFREPTFYISSSTSLEDGLETYVNGAPHIKEFYDNLKLQEIFPIDKLSLIFQSRESIVNNEDLKEELYRVLTDNHTINYYDDSQERYNYEELINLKATSKISEAYAINICLYSTKKSNLSSALLKRTSYRELTDYLIFNFALIGSNPNLNISNKHSLKQIASQVICKADHTPSQDSIDLNTANLSFNFLLLLLDDYFEKINFTISNMSQLRITLSLKDVFQVIPQIESHNRTNQDSYDYSGEEDYKTMNSSYNFYHTLSRTEIDKHHNLDFIITIPSFEGPAFIDLSKNNLTKQELRKMLIQQVSTFFAIELHKVTIEYQIAVSLLFGTTSYFNANMELCKFYINNEEETAAMQKIAKEKWLKPYKHAFSCHKSAIDLIKTHNELVEITKLINIFTGTDIGNFNIFTCHLLAPRNYYEI